MPRWLVDVKGMVRHYCYGKRRTVRRDNLVDLRNWHSAMVHGLQFRCDECYGAWTIPTRPQA